MSLPRAVEFSNQLFVATESTHKEETPTLKKLQPQSRTQGAFPPNFRHPCLLWRRLHRVKDVDTPCASIGVWVVRLRIYGYTRTGRDDAGKAEAYLRRYGRFMSYAEMKSRGFPIGSGVVESALQADR